MQRHRGGRRRPGRRPPYHYRGPAGPPRATGFTGPGFRQCYDVLTPWMRGRQRKAFFNLASGWIVLVAGLWGGLMGFNWLGWPGAVVGLGLTVAAAGSWVERGRFYRP